MIMDKYFISCEYCYIRLNQKSQRVTKVWMELCALAMIDGEIIQTLNKDCSEFRTLETMGFIVSTERTDGLSIRVLGHGNTIAGEHYFCPHGGCVA